MALLLGAGSVPAQADVAVDGFRPAPDAHSGIALIGTRTPGHLNFDIGLSTHHSFRLLADELGGVSSDLIRHRLALDLQGQLGVGERAALALRLPFLLDQRGTSGASLGSAGVGDPELTFRLRPIGHPVTDTGDVKDGGALGVFARITIPYDLDIKRRYFAEPGTRSELGLTSDVLFFGIGAGIELAYVHRFDPVYIGNDKLQHGLRGGAFVNVPVPILAQWYPDAVREHFVLELESTTNLDPAFEPKTTPLEARFAYRLEAGDYHASVGLGAGLLDDAVGSPALRSFLMLGYSPRVHDMDGDRVADADDQCEHLAEDHDGYEDADGCPEPDNDGDLVLDEDDQCPLVAAEEMRDEDEDGCTDP